MLTEDGLAAGGDLAPEKMKSSRMLLDHLVALEDLRLVDEAHRRSGCGCRCRTRPLSRPGVVGVERSVAAVEGAVGAANLAGIGGAGPGVVAEQFEAVLEGTTDADGQRVVPGVGDAEAGVVGLADEDCAGPRADRPER